MRKLPLLFLIIFLINENTMFAQVFKKNINVLNLGVGIGDHLKYWGSGYHSSPYFSIAFDRGIYDFPNTKNLSLGIGGYLGYRIISHVYTETWRDKNGNVYYESVKKTWTYTEFGIRPTIHYSLEDVKAEIYGGMNIGYAIIKYKYKYNNPNLYYSVSNDYTMRFGIMIGGRYYFSELFGIYTELGYGISYLNFGITLKF